MAYTFAVNGTPATSSIAMYQLISTLMTAGWLKKADSDGVTYSSSGVQVTSGNIGTNGLNNTKAWVRLQSPSVNGQTREFTFQRGTTFDVWRIKYSASAGFTGGSPAATVTPSSTDEVFMLGGATDASPTFFSWFTTDNGYYWNIACGGSTEFYSFIAWGKTIGALTSLNAICLDVMAAGSYPSADIDPAVVYCSNAGPAISQIVSSAAVTTNVTNAAFARAWLGATSAAGASGRARSRPLPRSGNRARPGAPALRAGS